ncbi:M13 family metallopeptidase [Algivirga pacifica]|uniref:M13 family metallopeptidase n=1 Tax=Algivirga pacifica TaxID=1162670 RepID=A0ABP9DES7_9BACT
MNNKLRGTLGTLLAASVAMSCQQGTQDHKEKQELTAAISLEHMDHSITPGDDFYQFVNGSWLKNTEIPAEETRWGSFMELRDKTDSDVLALLKETIENNQYGKETDQYKALKVYEAMMNADARNKAGVSPLKPYLDKIESVQDLTDLNDYFSEEVALTSSFFSLYSYAGLNNPDLMTIYLGPGALGLPERDYYLKEDEKSVQLRQQYLAHVSKMMQYLGADEATASKEAATILEIETKLARPRLDKVARRNPDNRNNPRTLEQLSQMTPAVEWTKIFGELGIQNLEEVLVSQVAYMEELNEVLKSTPIEELKTYMRWTLLNDAANYLSLDIEKQNWTFYMQTLRGAQEQKPMDERNLSRLNRMMGEAIGQLYVDKHFPAEAKAEAEEMISYVVKAFGNRIDQLEWMKAETKEKAKEKLTKCDVKIGYPDKWKDYSALEINEEGSAYAHKVAIGKWALKTNLAKYKKPVDKTEWGMPPQTVNAYFNPLKNEIVFPAAILQPPFYNQHADVAVNFGGIGAVIGHEISHAFDDSGAKFDANGKLRMWWDTSDFEEFQKRGNALSEQYSAIEVLDGVFVNGDLTLGENIGDLGGVLAAYDGLQMYLNDNGRPEAIDNFSPEQRFFISWATIWRSKMREARLRELINTDPHSPAMVRGIQPLLNVDAFYEAFSINEGDQNYIKPEERVRIW